jgi:hypothetical protein
VDALVARPRVLAGKANDQLLHLLGDRRSAGGGGRVGPVPADHAPMPAQQRLVPYQEHRPARRWEHPAQRRQQRTVGGLQARPRVLAAQQRKLVAQHQDLDLLGRRRPETKQGQLKGTAQRQVDKRPDHNPSPRGEGKQARTDRSPSPRHACWSRPSSTSGTPRAGRTPQWVSWIARPRRANRFALLKAVVAGPSAAAPVRAPHPHAASSAIRLAVRRAANLAR